MIYSPFTLRIQFFWCIPKLFYFKVINLHLSSLQKKIKEDMCFITWLVSLWRLREIILESCYSFLFVINYLATTDEAWGSMHLIFFDFLNVYLEPSTFQAFPSNCAHINCVICSLIVDARSIWLMFRNFIRSRLL